MTAFKFFKDKNFDSASSPSVNPPNNSNTILQKNKNLKDKFESNQQVDINSSEQKSSILNKGPGKR
jgi:hypothetical protein